MCVPPLPSGTPHLKLPTQSPLEPCAFPLTTVLGEVPDTCEKSPVGGVSPSAAGSRPHACV